jgi:hypothetical protein
MEGIRIWVMRHKLTLGNMFDLLRDTIATK